MRFIFLALVIVVISLPEYEAGYMQYLKNLLSMQNQDEELGDNAGEENPSERTNLARDLEVFSSEDKDSANIQSTGSMRILFAYYGLSCAKHNNLKFDIQCKWTRWARDECLGKSTCTSEKMTYTSSLGDPYPYCNKDFLVVAECPDGEIIADYISPSADFKKFTLSCTNTV